MFLLIITYVGFSLFLFQQKDEVSSGVAFLLCVVFAFEGGGDKEKRGHACKVKPGPWHCL